MTIEEKIYVYVIGREEGPVKVGISKNPNARAACLQEGCPFKLDVLHKVESRNRKNAFEHEQIFHEVYQDYRLIGEWFDLDADAAIEGVDTGFQIEAHFEERERIQQLYHYKGIVP